MGFIVQKQRRAIESLSREPEAVCPPPPEDFDWIARKEGKLLRVAGISKGYGTCSDMHGMDVLVLTERKLVNSAASAAELACAAYTVLVRNLTEQEAAEDELSLAGISRVCVELLKPISPVNNGLALFEPTGKIAHYTPLH